MLDSTNRYFFRYSFRYSFVFTFSLPSNFSFLQKKHRVLHILKKSNRQQDIVTQSICYAFIYLLYLLQMIKLYTSYMFDKFNNLSANYFDRAS